MSSLSKTLDSTPKTSDSKTAPKKTLESETSKTTSKTLDKTQKTLPKILERKIAPKTYFCREFSVDDILEMINNPAAFGLEIQSVEISAEKLVEDVEVTEEEYQELLNNPVECIDGETAEIN
jgi:hypothetical protein